MSVHSDCEYYHSPDDLCILYFELTTLAFNVSKNSDKCLGVVIYGEEQ